MCSTGGFGDNQLSHRIWLSCLLRSEKSGRALRGEVGASERQREHCRELKKKDYNNKEEEEDNYCDGAEEGEVVMTKKK